ncbi:hypothetical protein SDC9_100045 [bioreactor metagenome]|uniref:AlgX/AlgJ SGNH hydrolase-like domain-containing protein n=1 Tax=bioreactor metagenome TaxID=1076179 RepID=A0A645AKL9_9ZZZZ|nr:hypothetical protein [Oscillospiraceae bacterium]
MSKFFTQIVLFVLTAAFLFSCSSPNHEISGTEATGDASGTETAAIEKTTGGVTTPTEYVTETETQTKTETEAATLYDETCLSPVITDCKNTRPDKIVITGKCEPDAVIKITFNKETISAYPDHGYFVSSIALGNTKSATISIIATAEGKNDSKPVTKNIGYRSGCYVYNDDWHIFVSDFNYRGFLKYTINDLKGETKLNDSQLELLKEKTAYKTEYLKSDGRNAELIILLAPNPSSVYSDELKKQIKISETTKRDQVLEALAETDAVVIDLYDVFYKSRDGEFTPYLRTDSHWSEYGAYLALTELTKYISQKFPAAAPHSFEEYGFKLIEKDGGDIAYYLETDETKMREFAPFAFPTFEMPVKIKKYKGNCVSPDFDVLTGKLEYNTCRDELPSAYVIRDSYGCALTDLLAERFDKTYYQTMWQYQFDTSVIKSMNPDYVIYVLTERNLDVLLK